MEYVSFDTAKLLKEKGFSENTEHKIWYVIKQFSTGCHWNSCTYKVGDVTREYNGDCCIPMPTLQMAMKWLKDNHDIDIDTKTVWGMDKVITYYVKGYRFRLHSPIFPNYDVNEIFPTREMAYDEAIKKCLTDLM